MSFAQKTFLVKFPLAKLFFLSIGFTFFFFFHVIMRHINENIKIMRKVVADVEEKASNVVLDQRFSEIDDESLLGENSSADEGFEVPHSPLHFEAIQVDFVELIRWENY